MKRTLLGCLLLSLVLAALPAEKLRRGWLFSEALAGSLNPLGADMSTKLSYLVPLFPEKTGPLWDQAAFEAGLQNNLTPAYEQIGAFVRIEPVAVFDVSFSAAFRYAYDALGFGFTGLADYDAAYDSAFRRDLPRKAGPGFRWAVNPTLKAAWGDFVFASAFSFAVYDMRGTEKHGYYYEPYSDKVLKTFDGTVSNDTLAAWEFRKGFYAGLLHSLLVVPGSGELSERLAAMGSFSFPIGRALVSLNLLAGTYLADEYYSYRDGKIYLAAKSGISFRLD